MKLPALFGIQLSPDEEVPAFYLRNASLFAFPLLAAYFVWKRSASRAIGVWLAVAFAAAAMFANVYPFAEGSDTQALTALHLPIALWLAVGFAYVGGRWLTDGGRMNFVRFSGELFIYYVLMALGGAVLTAFTVMMFAAIDKNAGVVRRALAAPVRRGGRRHRRILAGRGEAERHREHGAGADQAVHAAVHGPAAGVSGDDGRGRAVRSTSSVRC